MHGCLFKWKVTVCPGAAKDIEIIHLLLAELSCLGGHDNWLGLEAGPAGGPASNCACASARHLALLTQLLQL